MVEVGLTCMHVGEERRGETSDKGTTEATKAQGVRGTDHKILNGGGGLEVELETIVLAT